MPDYIIQSHQAAQACGVADSRLQLYEELKGKALPKPPVCWHEIEKAAIRLILPYYEYTPPQISAVFPWMKASEGYATEDGDGAVVLWTAAWDDGIPEEYLIRAQHDMEVRHWKTLHFLLMDRGGPVMTDIIEYDRGLAKSVREQEYILIRQLQSGIRPEPNCDADLDILYPDGHSGAVEADEQIIACLKRSLVDRNIITIHTASCEMEKLALKVLMGGASFLTHDHKTIATLKIKHQNRFQTKKLKRNDPIIYKNYLQETASRELRVKWNLLPPAL